MFLLENHFIYLLVHIVKRFTNLFVIILYFNQLAFAQPFPHIFFRNINEKNGLSINSVSDIKEDKDGFIWIATADGLNKYDGEKFEIYRNGNNTIDILDNAINKIHFDKHENLWLSYYDGVTKINLKNKTDKIKIDGLTDVKMSTYNEKMYISERKGIFEIDITGNTTPKMGLISPRMQNATSYNRLRDVYFYNRTIYSFISNAVFKLNDNFEIIKEYKIPTNLHIQNLYFTENKCYIASWGTPIYVLNLDSGECNKIDFINSSQEQHIAFNIVPWKFKGKEYLIVAASNFIIIIDPITNKGFQYAMNGDVFNVFVDSKNNLWVATSSDGIFFASSIQEVFDVVSMDNNQDKKPNAYNYHLEYIDQQFWLSTRYHTGFYQSDKMFKDINHYGRNNWIKPNEYGGLAPYLDAFDFIKYKNIIVASGDFGMYEIDPIKHITTFIKLDSFDIKLRNIIPKNDNEWFVRSVNKGVFLYDPTKRMFNKLYKVVDENNTPVVLNYMFRDRKDNIYVSSHVGLYNYNILLDSFVKIIHNPLENTIIYQIDEDHNNKLWLSTNKGIYVYDEQRKKITSLSEINQKVARANNIKIDERNNIWFCNERGIHYYNQTTNILQSIDSKLELFKTTDYSILGSFDGKMFVGADNYILKIDIEKFENYRMKSTLHITSILVNNNEKLESTSDYQYDLSSDEQNLKISFAVPCFDASDNISYQFRIFNTDTTWVNLNEGELYLPNLNYGTYHIQFRGSNKITNEYTTIKDLYLKINSPWYLSLWFKSLAFVLICGTVYLIYKYRIRQINHKVNLEKRFHEKVTGLEMQNLRSQMNPHFLFNALNSINSFIVLNKTRLASEYLTKFSRLIRLILDNSKHEIISLEKELETLRLYLLMESLRFENAFEYEIMVSPDLDISNVFLPPMIIQPYAENAIWHGLMHKETKGNVLIDIFNDPKNSSCLVITITDNGIGRSHSQELKSKTGNKHKSYGIDITEQRIKFFNTKNYVEISDLYNANQEPAGTEVRINLLTTNQ